ncbi:EF-hand, partial [Backusella circina FSU 941]
MTQNFRFTSEFEKKAYEGLFKSATKGEKPFLYKQEAVTFFEKSGLPVAILKQILDTMDADQINQIDFFTILKLIACYQNETPVTNPIDMVQVPLPQFRDLPKNTLNDIKPMTEAEREKYIQVFEACNPVDGVIDDEFAMGVFTRSNIPMEKLNLIWNLAATRKSNTLNKTEFIIAMHYISRSMSNANIDLPTSLPSQTYMEATGKFRSSLHRQNTVASPIMRNRNVSNSSLVSSPLSSPRMVIPVTISLDESERYKSYFERLDTDNLGYLSGEVAAYFFNHSKLSEADLGQIWNLADTKRIGKLDLNGFSVAMHLITRRQNGDSMQEVVYRANELNQMHIQPIHNELMDHKRKSELEKQLDDIKKEVQAQWQLAEEYRIKKKELSVANNQLEKDVFQAKDKLELAKKLSGEAEKMLEMEQERRDALLRDGGLTSSLDNSLELNTKEPALPDLTRTPSYFSFSTGLVSPTTPATNLNPGKFYLSSSENEKPQVPLSPVQSKVISKYGFDITAFEVPSNSADDGMSDKDELASLFGVPVIPKKETATFDAIFM